MMVEKPRAEFLRMVADQLSSGSWSAVVLLIPPEWLHDRNIAGDEADRIIASGVKMLLSLGDGMYARIAWCVYFAICRNAAHQIASTLKGDIARARLDDELLGLWRFSVQPLTSSPAKLFGDMEIATHEKAIADAEKLRASKGD